MSNKEIDIVIIGDLAFNHDIAPNGEKTSIDGAAYYSAVGASLFNKKVGVVAKIGGDFDLSYLHKRSIDIEGVKVIPDGKTCRFVLRQYSNNTREFSAERGVTTTVETKISPKTYMKAKYIHLATQLSPHCLIWMDALENNVEGVISADFFEAFVKQFPNESQWIFKRARIVFTNEVEFSMLRQLGKISFKMPIILKKGATGAVYIKGTKIIAVDAPKVEAIETTGVGDVLAGAFLALRAKNISVAKALEKAVYFASQSIADFGVEHIVTANQILGIPKPKMW